MTQNRIPRRTVFRSSDHVNGSIAIAERASRETRGAEAARVRAMIPNRILSRGGIATVDEQREAAENLFAEVPRSRVPCSRENQWDSSQYIIPLFPLFAPRGEKYRCRRARQFSIATARYLESCLRNGAYDKKRVTRAWRD